MRTRSVLILFQNHPQRYEKLICFQSYTATHQRKIHWLERDLKQIKTSVKSWQEYFVHLNWIRLATNPC